MAKSITSALILLAFLVQSISKTIILMQFQANQQFIEVNLCVKRNVFGNCCRGKCELKRQLERDENCQGSASDKIKHKAEKSEFYNNGIGLKIDVKNVMESFMDFRLILLPGNSSAVFRPPAPYLT